MPPMQAASIAVAASALGQTPQPSTAQTLTFPTKSMKLLLLPIVKDLDQKITKLATDLKTKGVINDRDISDAVNLIKLSTQGMKTAVDALSSVSGLDPQEIHKVHCLAEAAQNLFDSYAELKQIQVQSSNPVSRAWNSRGPGDKVLKAAETLEGRWHNLCRTEGLLLMTAETAQKELRAISNELEVLAPATCQVLQNNFTVSWSKPIKISDNRIDAGLTGISLRSQELNEIMSSVKTQSVALPKFSEIENQVSRISSQIKKGQQAYSACQALESTGVRWDHLPSNFKMQGLNADTYAACKFAEMGNHFLKTLL